MDVSDARCLRLGVQPAPFIEDVEEFLDGRDTDTALRSLNERLQQYKIREMRLLAQRRDYQLKLPDIRKCLAIVETLQRKQGTGLETKVDFEVTEGIYTQAVLKDDTTSVYLWLGANVMLEYSFEEAQELLAANASTAEKGLQGVISDTQFLRDMVNITEVTSSTRLFRFFF
eukprot:TRINITY_DN6917_c0_g1_i2.p1 TRINITY_DN6917_c0_g1~~TRINITY_DN6917_c0_g1_i2.p1  ORF type:complete len:172 (+),score=33.07 TRINITY_DN6917_c0_g1_i2:178-693(+)